MEQKSEVDIFERFRDYPSRGFYRRVTHPVLKDTTNLVREDEEFRHRNDTSYKGVSRDIKYFGFFDPETPNTTYARGLSRDVMESDLAKRAQHMNFLLVELRGPKDKIVQKMVCSESGAFPMIRHIDLGTLFTEADDPVVFEFQPESYGRFPIGEIVDSARRGIPQTYVFENPVDGFVIRTSKEGVKISGDSEYVRNAVEESLITTDPRRKISSFLERLSAEGYTLQKIGYIEGVEMGLQRELIGAVIAHPKNLYIKGARTGGGDSVIRVRKEDGKVYVESDSEVFEIALREIIEDYRGQVRRYRRLERVRAPKGILKDNEPMPERYNINDPWVVLNKVLRGNINYRGGVRRILRHPIIEEEIPFETVNGDRVEFRVICQKPGDDFEITHYTKRSPRTVSANLALGGRGELLRNTLHSLVSQRHPNLSGKRLEEMVTETETDLIVRARQFAEYVVSHNITPEGVGKPGSKPTLDFAIDVVPSWNEGEEKFDFYFLEMDFSYLIRGLNQAHGGPERGDLNLSEYPVAVQRVISNRKKIKGEREN